MDDLTRAYAENNALRARLAKFEAEHGTFVVVGSRGESFNARRVQALLDRLAEVERERDRWHDRYNAHQRLIENMEKDQNELDDKATAIAAALESAEWTIREALHDLPDKYHDAYETLKGYTAARGGP